MNLRKIPGTTYKIGERFTLIPTPRRQPVQAHVVVSHGVRRARVQGRPARLASLRRHQLPRQHLGERHPDRDAPPRWPASSAATSSTSRRSRTRGRRTRWRWRCSAPSPTTSRSCGSTGTPPPPTRTWACGATCTSRTAGPLALRNPHVVTELDLPSLATARLTVTAEVKNGTDRPSPASCAAPSRAIRSRKPVSLAPRETQARALHARRREPALDAEEPTGLVAVPDGHRPSSTPSTSRSRRTGAVSDRQQVRFGVHEMTSELTDKGHRALQGERQERPHPRRRLGLRHAPAAHHHRARARPSCAT